MCNVQWINNIREKMVPALHSAYYMLHMQNLATDTF